MSGLSINERNYLRGQNDGENNRDPAEDGDHYLAGYARGYEIAQQMDEVTKDD